MTEAPMVSMVINNHNYGRYLGAAIESALSQTYPCTEVIVVDDGSTDESADVMARFGGRIIPIHQHQGGQASAVNTGFAHCRGDIAIFLDADDALLPQIARKVVEVFRAAPDMARVQYRLAVVGDDGVPTGELVPAADALMPNGDRRRELAKFNNYAWWPPMSGNAFSTTSLRRILPMPEPLFRQGADYYLVRAATLCGPIRSLDEIGGNYRRHRANIDLRAGLDLEQTRDNIRLIRDAHDFLKQFAIAIGFCDFPNCASDALDLRFFALRMVSLGLSPSEHPLGEDRLLSLAWRGATVALRQTQRTVAFRCLAAAWFAAMFAAPPVVRWSLADWFFYPQTRPHAGGRTPPGRGRWS